MEVNLINYTPDALALLIYTKNTRLQGKMSLLEIKEASPEWQMEQLSYMRDTIKSSWEFVDYVFEINNVSRAFTHQLVRTRQGSYAQESHRSGDLSDHLWVSPSVDKYSDDVVAEFDNAMEVSFGAYEQLISEGMERQDARGLIPTNVETHIIAKFNLRTLHQMAEVRLCTRTQGEYQDVFRAMKAAIIEVHPWADDFINVFCANHGTCCFPRYTECPIQKYTLNSDQERLNTVKRNVRDEHERNRHAANPEARGGETM